MKHGSICCTVIKTTCFAHLNFPDMLMLFTSVVHQSKLSLVSLTDNDCTIQRIAHPTWFQHQAYNGHKKFHALKFQALMLPNGIIGHLYGPFEGRRNDNILLTESGLLERLAQFAHQ